MLSMPTRLSFPVAVVATKSALFVLAFSISLSSALFAQNNTETAQADSVLDKGLPFDSTKIKRDVMSQPGVFVDMDNLRRNGYKWTNDAVWAGTEVLESESWYVAGFLFEREGYKGVWLQYSFALDESSGEIDRVRPWRGGTAVFR